MFFFPAGEHLELACPDGLLNDYNQSVSYLLCNNGTWNQLVGNSPQNETIPCDLDCLLNICLHSELSLMPNRSGVVNLSLKQ